jgi:hypothetical protein
MTSLFFGSPDGCDALASFSPEHNRRVAAVLPRISGTAAFAKPRKYFPEFCR